MQPGIEPSNPRSLIISEPDQVQPGIEPSNPRGLKPTSTKYLPGIEPSIYEVLCIYEDRVPYESRQEVDAQTLSSVIIFVKTHYKCNYAKSYL